MPVCENCRQEGVDFYEDGGLFYCNACDTQSQVMRVLEKDEDYQALTFGHSYKTAKKKPTKKKEVEEKDSDSEKDVSWWSSEIYQAVLKAQVKALIKIGFPSRLDEIVLQLWIRFLRKSGGAFCDSSEVSNAAGAHVEESDDSKEKAEKTRENNQEDQISPEPKKKKLKYRTTKRVYSKDDFIHRSLKRKAVKDASEDKQEQMVRLLIWDSVCFMYLALHILDEPVFLSDMIRWVREGQLPLKATADVLPEHIAKNLSLQDVTRFCSPTVFIPDVGYLNDSLQRVAAKLDITPRPINQQDMSLVIAKMVYTLNLPEELCQLAYQISTQVQHLESKQKAQDFSLEWQALSYIVVALKLLFTLDDRTEHAMSYQTRCLQSLFHRVRLFNWDTWVEAQKLRIQDKFYREGTALDSSDMNRPFGIDGFVHHFNSMYHVEQVNKYSYIKTGQRRGRQTTLKEYQRPFRALGRDSSFSATSPSSAFMQGSVTTMPLPHRQPNSKSTSKNKKSISESDIDFDWLPRQYLLKEDFSKHTLKHLTNLQELGEQYIVSPQHVSRVLDLAENRNCSSNMESGNGASEPETKRSRKKKDSCDGNKSCRTKKKGEKVGKKQKVPSKKPRKGIDKNRHENSSGSSESETETSERPKPSRLDCRANTYFLYPRMISRYDKRPDNASDCFHTSVAWLLEHLCNIFEMKTYFLARFVNNAEKALFKVQPDA